MAAPMKVPAVLTRNRLRWVFVGLVCVLTVTLAEETETSDSPETKQQQDDIILESVFDPKVFAAKRPGERSQRQNDEGVSETVTSENNEDDSKLFSLTSLIKSLFNPVIEEFQVGSGDAAEDAEKVNSDEEPRTTEPPKVAIVSNETVIPANVTELQAVNTTANNDTDSSKKFKFQCVGRNVTENTTLEVRLVNSSTLLEVLSFDKNRTSGDCVLVMFYAPWCQFCAKTAPHYNALARAFPQLEVLAVDAVHFSNLNARFGTVAVPNVMLFHQSRSAVRFNHTERVFHSFIQFIKNVTGLEPNTTVNITDQDYLGPLSSVPTQDPDFLLWVAWVFVITCSSYIFINSQYGQHAINRVRILWQEHQHIE